MARKKAEVEEPPTVRGGNYGRVGAPPEGGLFIRDPVAASALAVEDAIQRFKDAGEEVPEHLLEQSKSLGQAPADSDAVILVDAVTGEFLADVDVQEPTDTLPDQTAPEPEPDEEPEAVPEGTPDETEESQPTVAERRAARRR